MKYSELIKILKRNGCELVREGANHSIWRSPITNEQFPVSRHKGEDVPVGTLKSIEAGSGIKITK